MLLCGLTDKDLRRICRSQYEYPGSAIGYWPERCLGHVYMVPEPIGSTGSVTLELLWEIVCGYRMLSGVPDEIPDVTRSSGMVRR